MTATSLLLRITCLLLFVGLGGCASWQGEEAPEPQVHLVKVEVVRARLLEQKFMLHFRVDNPGDSDLTVRGLTYRIHLGDLLLTEGEHEHWFTVSPPAQRLLQGADPHQPVAAGAAGGEVAGETPGTDPLSSGR
nr:hypothetical protein GCM10020185_15280 [Pseudomonas brassicacearum subsp. brassicacearum]